MNAPVVDWLLEGDPAIRWQVQRDLLDLPESTWQAERSQALSKGWVSEVLAHQEPSGDWPTGRWIGAPWILLTLIDCGVPPSHEPVRRAASQFLDRVMPAGDEQRQIDRMDLCHLGFWLRIGAYFQPEDLRLSRIVECLAETHMPDGGWNCSVRKKPTRHSSFHTTFNVLEGLREAAAQRLAPAFPEMEARAIEFMLQHQLYRSDKTGEVISERFTHLTYPSYWHYTVLRGLDYIRTTPFAKDPRLSDPINLLMSQQGKSGRWKVEKKIPGLTYFDMEPLGKDSRWNTLRALRVLRSVW